MIWVQTVCRSNQQTTLRGKEQKETACNEIVGPTERDNESVHEISNNVVCSTCKASDQPAHTRSLIRAFASRLSIL